MVGKMSAPSSRAWTTPVWAAGQLSRRRSVSTSSVMTLSRASKQLLADTGARIPIIKGPMYPGSNAELVAAVSEAGGFGVVQPLSLTHLYGHDFREGLRLIKSLTSAPFGVNFTLLENKRYKKQVEEWMDIAIDEGIKFFLTSLGKPDAVVRVAERHGIKVYHDVHTPEFARKAADAGVHGLNCLNSSMGGQTGNRESETFLRELQAGGLDGIPLIQAGGVGDASDLRTALEMGYAGCQLGTRFLATQEARVTDSYKQAIVRSRSDDIVWTNKLAGTNSSVIRTAQIEAGGLRVGAITEWLLRNPYTKTLTRMYMLKSSIESYKRAAFDDSYEIWQAGKGVERIDSIETCAEVLRRFGEVARLETH